MPHSFRCRSLAVIPFACALMTTLSVAPAHAQSAPADAELQQQVNAIAAEHHGHVTLYATQLNTGRTVSYHPDEPVPTASVIKLAVLYEAMQQVRSGKVAWSDKITLGKGEAVNGSGILTFFDAPLNLTFKDVLTFMIIVSDNTATNLAIDHLGIDNINARVTWLGLHDTRLYKHVMKPPVGPMPSDQPKFGLGKTTAREMAIIIRHIGQCDLATPTHSAQPISPSDQAICSVALNMLRNQFYRDSVPRYLEKLDTSENGSAIANKTGGLNLVRNDVAIVAGKTGPMILSIFTYDNQDQSWTADNEGELTIAKLARAVVTAWSPNGLDGKTLVPGLGISPSLTSKVTPAPASASN
jgi:beta-lactamase class A